MRNSERVFDVSPLESPNPHCAVCRAVYVPVRIVEDVTLGELVKTLVGGEEGKPIPFGGIISVQEGSRMLFESEDFEDNADKTLKELGIGVGKFVTISDDDEPHWPVQLCLGRYVWPARPSSCTRSRAKILRQTFDLRSYLPASSSARIEFDSSAIPSPIPMRAPPPEPEADSDAEEELSTVVQGAAAVDPEAGRPGAKITGKKRTADEAGLPESEGDVGEAHDDKKKKTTADYLVLEDDDENVMIDLT